MPEQLLESELFGHVKGAFTDARITRTGLFVQASGGTLFLDEVGELPLGLQPKLLRALQERKVRLLGSNEEVEFDARIVAATNRDLELAVEEGRFREDLYYRLNVINIELPPLRARGNDVLLLSQHFVEHFATRTGKRVLGLSPAAAQKLLAYSWPGNVRELQNCIERAVALTTFEQLTVEDLPERVRNYTAPQVLPEVADMSELVTLEEVERRYIHRVLEAVGGSRTLAARILGVDRKTLYRKLHRGGEEEPKA
jgi:transcriptional regulator with PAS, ATPase and Fis domain